MKTAIVANGKNGFIFYNKNTKDLMITHPDEKVREKIKKYMNTPKQMKFPAPGTGGTVTGYRTVTDKPINNLGYMYMAAVEMCHHIDVSPDWDNEENKHDITIPTVNMQKSIEYDLIIQEVDKDE